MSCRTMISARTICFVYFVLFLATTHAVIDTTEASTPETYTTNQNTTINRTSSTLNEMNQKQNEFNTGCVCTSFTPKPMQEHSSKGHCLLFWPKDDNKGTVYLIVAALTLACFTLLLTTLICACQLCHLKVMFSRFQPHQNNIDLQAVRKRSESPCRDDGRPVGEPTETCLMLSEVTTQEEENKEESVQPNTEPSAEGPNGDVAQEEGSGCEAESKEPDVEAPESSAIEV